MCVTEMCNVCDEPLDNMFEVMAGVHLACCTEDTSVICEDAA